MAQAVDLETNPGPRPPKYPCGSCGKAVTFKHKGVCCDRCDYWFHHDCQGLSSNMYSYLGNSNVSWVCLNCGLPNFSTTFFNSSNFESDTNPFSPLSENSPGAPQAASSPKSLTRNKHPMLKPGCAHPGLHRRFLELLSDQNMAQIVDKPTRTNGTLVSDSKLKANLLNHQFQSVFTHEPPNDPLPDLGPSPHASMSGITIEVSGVDKLLNNLNIHKASGPDQVHAHVLKELRSVLSPILQHGFSHGKSCETQLLSLTDDLAFNRNNGTQTDLIFMDFAKAFDKVPHRRLLHKLQYYGVRGNTLVWVQNFLLGRSQTVVLDGERSDPMPVTSGVPQGTVLGPILFLAYINDLPEHAVSAKEDIDNISLWERRWLMEFNPSKCEVMTIPSSKTPITHSYILHNQLLNKVSSTRYLGVTISSNLTWGSHVDAVSSKANKTLGMLRRCLRIASTAAKERAYMALVRPQVEYACSVWDPHTQDQVGRIEMVQRRAARYVTNNYYRTSSVTDMINKLGWQSLAHRRKNARLATLYKITNNVISVPHASRVVPATRCSRRTNHALKLQTIAKWNELEPGVAEAGSLAQFKSGLARTLLH
ncbi:hypothetical protein Bbelb_060610 [Branchiostoma belcheri]|nr:hypothetical protein Bbelb_060610 [Branchiostoma belcheri]